MKKSIYLTLAASLFAVSCKTKSTVASESHSGKVVAVSPSTTGKKALTADYLAQGKNIFENSCAKCHNLPNPAKHTDQQWVGLVNSMAPKAHLTSAQSEMVYDYVTSKN